MKYLLIPLLLCGMALTTARAQNSDIQSYVRTLPPTVASLMKNIDHPVGLYHGNPEIAHTLYTLKDGAIELPVTLQYNASGIKVNEEASWVGLGWNLSMGGMVVQNVVGESDIAQSYTSCCQDYYPVDPFEYYKQIPYKMNDKNKYSGFFTSAMEGALQPDVFYFVYPGGSGKFIIDYRDNSIHRLDDRYPLKIEKLANGWRITTAEGICHTFDKVASSFLDGRANGCTHYLTSSTYPNGQTVSYGYTFKEVTTYYPYEKRTAILQRSGPAVPNCEWMENSLLNIAKNYEGILSSITTTNYLVTFTHSSREDVNNACKLDEIKITSRNNAGAWGNPQKRFKFSYGYFTAHTTGSYWNHSIASSDMERLNKRLKLLSVCESDASGIEDGKLTFDYYGPDLPRKSSYAIDYWGYYNGQTSNASLLPKLKYLLTDKTALSWVNNTGTAVRAYSFNHCMGGMLKRITYPTRGYMEYTYEPHEFKSSAFIPTVDELEQGGVVTKTATSRNVSSDINSISIETAQGGQVDISLYIERGLNTWREMEGCRYLLEHCPVGGTYATVKDVTLTSFGTEQSGNYRDSFGFVSAGGSYRLTIWLPASIGNQMGSMTKHGLFTATMTAPLPEITARGYSVGGGLRVKKVTYHDGVSDAADYTLSYTYPRADLNAVSFVPLVFHRQYDGLKYVQLVYDSSGKPYSTRESQNSVELEVSGTNLTSAPYSSIGATVGYSTVTESRSGAGHTTYSFFNRDEVNANMSYQIPRPENGCLLEVNRYDESGTLVESEKNTFQSSKVHFYRGVSMLDKFNRTPAFYPNLIERYDLLDFGNYDGRYTTLLYAIDCYRIRPSRKEVIRDGVSTVHTYSYDSHAQLANETVTNSNGKEVATVYSYPYDFSCSPYTLMATKHMYAYPIEVKRLVAGKLADCHLTRYSSFGGLLLPQSESRGNLAAPVTNSTTFSCTGASAQLYPSADITCLKYDAQGNPVHVKVRGEDILYIWGYNCQYLVAEIRMSDYDSVRSALGCTPESMSSLAVPDASKLNRLRDTLTGAQVTTYTYKPLAGMASMTVPNGETTRFEYDGFGRLTKVLDHNLQTVKEYDYHYKN